MAMNRRRNVRLPSLAQVAGPDLLSLDLKHASDRFSRLGLGASPLTTSPRQISSQLNFRPSHRLSTALDDSRYDDPFATRSRDMDLDIPAQHDGNLRRLRHSSSASSLRGDMDFELSPPRMSHLPSPSDGFSGRRAHLPPLPPLGRSSRLMDHNEYILPTPLTANSGPYSHSNIAVGRGRRLSRHSMSNHLDPLDTSFGSSGKEQLPSLFSSTKVSSGGFSLPHLPGSSDSNLNSSSLLLPRLDTGASLLSRSSVYNPLPSPESPLSMTSSGLSDLGGSFGMGGLPAPTLSRDSRQQGTGHIVLSTDYRVVRMSPNTLLWLGLSHTMSLSAAGSALGSIYGRPLSSFVADEDKDLLNEFLTDLFMERRNAEKLKLHSVAEGGDGSAKGVSITVNFNVGYGRSRPFLITIWPITRRIQGYKHAVLTGEIVPAFADLFSPIKSVTPL